MASTFVVSRSQLIYALCLPLAVLIGYFLAEPLDSGSFAIVVLVLSVLSLPLLMKWYHPLLIMSWNAIVLAIGVPGRPFLWMVMAAVGLLIAVLNRSVNPNKRFINVPSLTKPLIFFSGVVVITAGLTGGIGLHAFGAARAGGRGYFFILLAVAGYFAMTSQRIPRERAGLYVALFFLSGLTSLVPPVAALFGAKSELLFTVFPNSDLAVTTGTRSAAVGEYSRNGAYAMASAALYGYLLARYGIRGMLDVRFPGRVFVFLLAMVACAYCGYRSALVLLILSFVAVFYWEGLHRTKMLPALIGVMLLIGGLMLTQAERLPLVVQRTMSFLPVKIDFLVRESAVTTTEWRVQMWKRILPTVPKYLLKGKGYNLSADDMYWANQNALLDAGEAGAAVAGDYHNGPLSTVIPFGIWGVIGFVWFLCAGLRYLHHIYRYGDPALRTVNTLLLASFAAKVIFFLFVFGSLYSDFFIFTGIVGLAVSLNGPLTAPVPTEAPEEALSSFSLRV